MKLCDAIAKSKLDSERALALSETLKAVSEACATTELLLQLKLASNSPDSEVWHCWVCKLPQVGPPAHEVQSMAGPFRYCDRCWKPL